jgi:hypothetical protein
VDYQALKEIASRSEKDRRELLAALSGVAEIRRELDEIERDLLKDARDAGASWAAIATALSLASRQAAEQRWLRLQGVRSRDPGRVRSQRAQRNEDEGPGLEELAKASDAARRELRARATGSAKEKLAAATLRQARGAPPGALYDLVRLALADLDADEGSAVVELRRALDTAAPALKD